MKKLTTSPDQLTEPGADSGPQRLTDPGTDNPVTKPGADGDSNNNNSVAVRGSDRNGQHSTVCWLSAGSAP